MHTLPLSFFFFLFTVVILVVILVVCVVYWNLWWVKWWSISILYIPCRKVANKFSNLSRLSCKFFCCFYCLGVQKYGSTEDSNSMVIAKMSPISNTHVFMCRNKAEGHPNWYPPPSLSGRVSHRFIVLQVSTLFWRHIGAFPPPHVHCFAAVTSHCGHCSWHTWVNLFIVQLCAAGQAVYIT